MDQFQSYELQKSNTQHDTYTLVIYLNDHLTEFASELGTAPKAKKDILSTARQVIRERYPNTKVNMVKVMIGGMLVASIPLMNNTSTVYAAESSTTTIQVAESSQVYYQVSSGDTLWGVSKKFNTSVDNIKKANNLTSNVLKVNQRLIIPKAFHTVKSGDYLIAVAKQYGVSVEAIKQANHKTSDLIRLGETLVIPVVMGGGTNIGTQNLAPTQMTSSYTVVAGDSLWGIAQKFNTSVSNLKSANNLTSDSLQIGQQLSIPTSGEVVPTPPPTPAPTVTSTSHTVETGDTLWGIANRYGTTVDALKQANQLASNVLQIGQTLTIPTSNQEAPTKDNQTSTPSPTTEVERITFTYAVRSGDNLSAIAERYGVTVDAIRSANGLTSDIIRVGQQLTIPNGTNAPTQTTQNTITYKTHTVVSGDNIWNLSVKYGIPQAELLRANNLTTSSMLSIGQKLSILVHNIAVKEVVSERHGEYMDWWTEAQYVFPINKTAKVTDYATGKSFYIKRTIGANHADSETLTANDSNIAKSIWGGYSWTPRAVVLEIDGRKVAASMSFMPHDVEYIKDNGITGHFDVYFGNSTRHKDGAPDASHQKQVEIAAGVVK
ncbi:muramidase family protein [Ornithinibacillus californiensis]|uniref:muramidase family protein n=1 Tax=Ornithinibacillus californiensis TaxID=161536 RepID=UPI00069E7238|nr:LysM peptidoglycan-binding domain-containing protein [Ornithinibacillus californiensis]